MKKYRRIACLLALMMCGVVFGQPAENTALVRQKNDADVLALKQHFHEKVDAGELVGTVMFLSRGDNLWTDVYGRQSIKEGISMSRKSIFRLASMTKPIVSVAAMMLVEQGKLSLDDRLADYIPAFANVEVLNVNGISEKPRRAITILDLMTHTSGISNTLFRKTPVQKIYAEALRAKNPRSLKELVEVLTTLPLAHHPGEKWTYGYSTDVLARVVEIVSGKNIEVYLQQEIFQPLHMSDTGFQVPQSKLSRFTAAYGRQLTVADLPDAESPYVNGKNFSRGAGGLVSTADDYLRFCKMLLNGGRLDNVRILQSQTVEQMMQNRLPQGVLPHMPDMPAICNGFGLGFGVQTDQPVVGSPGDCAWPGAYLTYFFIDQRNKSIGILLTQNTDFSNLPMLLEFHRMGSAAMRTGS